MSDHQFPFIYTTTGFRLPHTDYYTVFSDDRLEEGLLGSDRKRVIGNTFFADSELIKTNQVFHSDAANAAYKNFQSDPSFSNYLQLIDIAITVLSKCNLDDFFKIQMLNRALSPVSYMFCLDVYRDEFQNNYMQYDVVPMNVRFTTQNSTTQETLDRNVRKLKDSVSRIPNQWDKYLSNLADNKPAFLVFFKYIFVDTY